VLRVSVVAGVVAALFTASTSFSSNPGSKLVVVGTHLNNPRKLYLATDGSLYVVEAGRGGSDRCFGTGPDATCVGRTGSITRISDGRQTRVVRGLPSWAVDSGQRAEGPAAVSVRDGTFTILIGDAGVDHRGRNPFGRDGTVAGDLIATRSGAKPTVIANLAAFEANNNPDNGAGPGARFGAPAIDSNPYDFVPYRGGYVVADAGANDLLSVRPNGRTRVLAVFPTQVEKLTPEVARKIGASSSTRSIRVQSVPTSVAVGPDGALYVGELTGSPFQAGRARIWRVVPGKKPALYASGFTNIVDLAFSHRNLLVLEIASRGLYDPRASGGVLISLSPDGKREVLAERGLIFPTGLAVGANTIYISNYGTFRGTGPGPQGEVMKVEVNKG
jgi:hypothetical protein